MEGKVDIFDGFQAISDDLSTGSIGLEDTSSSTIERGGTIRKTPSAMIIDNKDDEDDDIEYDEDGNPIDVNDDEDDEDDDLTEEEKAAIELAKNKSKTKTKKQPKKEENNDDSDDDDEDESGLGEAEPEMAEYIQEQIFDKFNLDIEDEAFEKFKSINDVVDFVEEAIKVGSIPAFANDEVANIDEYVRNGGDLNKYMQSVYTGLDVDSVDIENESVQKQILRQDMINRGVPEKRINKRIERMDDNGMLREEAEDALESLEEFKAVEEQRLLAQQKKQKIDAENANLEFVSSVENELEAMNSVRGIPLSKAEKNKLFNYMLKPTPTGIPQYHIDYKNDRKNMIESAYFTMMGDKLVEKVKTKAKSNAAKKLKDKLADKGTRGKHQSDTGSNTSDVWGMISKNLR